MVPHAATATPTGTDDTRVYAALLLVILAVTGCYLLGCWLWPFGACRRCRGTGKRRSPFGRAFRLCHRCDGTGRTLRIGRHILNTLRELHDKGGSK
ncbi:hypothetical protein EV385_3747 [Krasilnikovia cinnamomea]|uniref:Uncharacterized protein n=1 Tax=Krasilnikovia cinnamomea TaxID=349313 RepID=A0A4Q7ZMQ0_9ACTN|nr:hypothetical protein [Krasilnikovia cinnamomea]RZU51911.1 hypothetical protein EV385_3747 [Krasilnikovia cinnamomea]